MTKPIDMKYPYCGERRNSPRRPARNQYEQQLWESLRGGKETIYEKPKKPKPRYDWTGREI